MKLLVALAVWSFDRVEPPYAVLVHDSGSTLDVPVSTLPPGARPGDRLASPRGPLLPRRDPASLRARLRRLQLAAEGQVRQGRSVGSRRRPDSYTRRAKAAGFRARSVFKLEEIDRRLRLLRGGQRVLDLGCAPGSWIQYVAKRVGPKGRAVGIDLQEVEALGPPQITLLQGDAFALDPEEIQAIAGGPFDVVLSDMAPATCGDRFTDHVRSIQLCERALEVARQVLRPGGAFVCKAFEGEDLNQLVAQIREAFDSAKRLKPKGTRKESVELFVIGQGHRPLVAEEG